MIIAFSAYINDAELKFFGECLAVILRRSKI